MLGQLTGEMRESVNPHEEQQAAAMGQPMFNLDGSMPPLMPTDGSGIGDNSDGAYSNLPSVPPDVPMDQSNIQGTDLLQSSAQPSDGEGLLCQMPVHMEFHTGFQMHVSSMSEGTSSRFV